MHKISKPQCRIIGIQRGQNVQDERTKAPRGEQARGRTSQERISQGANEPGVNKPEGEPAKGRKSQTVPSTALHCNFVSMLSLM